jgi:hypothetical protein
LETRNSPTPTKSGSRKFDGNGRVAPFGGTRHVPDRRLTGQSLPVFRACGVCSLL